MRKRFEQQISLGQLLIQDTVIPLAKRGGRLPALCAALKEIFITPEWNEQVFEVLESKILSSNNNTGRPGMDLWQIFVLSQVRLCMNISYDELHHYANYDKLIRQIMGIETKDSFDEQSLGYQRIIDNVGLLNDETVKELNQIIVNFGQGVLKKKEEEALCLKTDSFVVESNVHFPTDYNLLWDCARKCLDMIKALQKKYNNDIQGWRKTMDWHRELKNQMRALGRANGSGGKGKDDRQKKAAQKYLNKATLLLTKLETSRPTLPQNDLGDFLIIVQLSHYMKLLAKHIDLVERRIIKGEKIPHEEKLFSIFEPYTEWVTKGKLRPNVELGKKVAITTDQFDLIVDYYILENQSDSQIFVELVERIILQNTIKSWSFDKGFWHPDNKKLLKEITETAVLPKKGKRNKAEEEEERKPLFKKLRNKHSAVESNINELEHRGLNRCPDKGYANFKRYIGLAVCAYNLKKIGEQIIILLRKQQEIPLSKNAA